MRGGRNGRAPAWAKALAGLAVSMGLFLIVEALLAWGGVRPAREVMDPSGGYDTTLPLFARTQGPNDEVWLSTATNKLRFFNFQSMPLRKPPGTTRIVCLGGSTTYGHPYRDPVSFPGWLRELLREAAPERGWEVINAGGISYASHRERAVLAELLRYEPDIVILLNGHNEFLEDRTFRAWRERPPLFDALHRAALHARLYTVMSRFLARPLHTAPPREAREVETLLDKSIGLDAYRRDDARADAIVADYRSNMVAMARMAHAQGVRMIWVEPVSQLRGCAPFKSDGAPRDVEAPLEILREYVQEDPRNALLQYAYAEALLSAGRELEALPHYCASRDEDIVPLRATGPIIEAFHEAARAENVPVLPLSRLCAEWTRERSGLSIPGPELFTDHVHWTIEGYRLIALALLEQLNELGWIRPAVRPSLAQIESVTKRVESAQDAIAERDALRNLAKTLSWAGKTREAARLARLATEQLGPDAECSFIQGVSAAELKDWAEAERHYRLALELDPAYVKARLNLAVVLGRLGRDAEAVDLYRDVLRANPNYANAHYNLALVLDRLGRRDEALRHMARAAALDPRDEEAGAILAEWSP